MYRNSFIKKEDETKMKHSIITTMDMSVIMVNRTRKKITSWLLMFNVGT